MLTNDVVMSLYENVSRLTTEMLDAARKQDWAQLDSLESQCTLEISILNTAAAVAPFFGDLQTRKTEILKKILSDDRAIRATTQPWMDELQALMSNDGT